MSSDCARFIFCSPNSLRTCTLGNKCSHTFPCSSLSIKSFELEIDQQTIYYTVTGLFCQHLKRLSWSLCLWALLVWRFFFEGGPLLILTPQCLLWNRTKVLYPGFLKSSHLPTFVEQQLWEYTLRVSPSSRPSFGLPVVK